MIKANHYSVQKILQNSSFMFCLLPLFGYQRFQKKIQCGIQNLCQQKQTSGPNSEK